MIKVASLALHLFDSLTKTISTIGFLSFPELQIRVFSRFWPYATELPNTNRIILHGMAKMLLGWGLEKSVPPGVGSFLPWVELFLIGYPKKGRHLIFCLGWAQFCLGRNHFCLRLPEDRPTPKILLGEVYLLGFGRLFCLLWQFLDLFCLGICLGWICDIGVSQEDDRRSIDLT